LRLQHRLARLLGVVPLGLLIVLGSSPAVAAAGLPSRSGMLTGIDVSHWQGYINWSQVRGAGVKFAFAKATEGTKLVDARYLGNRDRAEAAGVRIGAYHFARPDRSTNDAVREANWFVDHAGRVAVTCCRCWTWSRPAPWPVALTKWVRTGSTG
jgi:GH25 family lysozyme M1 (1,4-beta-N-acetylmuramidase)